jgi:periplasmic nitrate reductase NapD
MASRRYHVSSAVVSVATGHLSSVLARLSAIDGVEIHATGASRIIITIEGWSTGQLGDRLTRIGLMDGVIAANMVFEHAEEEEALP